MLTGKCYKKDCAFLHDVEDITCRYYLMQQGCAMMSVHDGGDCPFKHTVDVQLSPSNISLSSSVMKQQEHGTEDTSTTDIHNQASFPSLPTTSTSTSSTSGGANASRSNSNNSHLYTQSEYASVLSRTQSGQGLANQSSSSSSFARVGSTGGGSGGSGGGIHGSGRQGSTNLLRSD